jgi:methyl-accepting chemotaxis protein
MKLNIRNQLLLAFGIVLVLAALIGWVGISQAGQINARAEALYSDDLVNTSLIANLSLLAMRDRAAELEILLAGTPESKAEHQREMETLDQEVAQALETLKTGDDDGHLSVALANFEQSWNNYVRLRDALSQLVSDPSPNPEAIAAAEEEVDQAVHGTEAVLTALVDASRAAGAERNDQNLVSYSQARWLIIAITVLVVVLGIAVAVFLSNRISKNLGVVAAAAEGLAGNDLTKRASVRSGDEVEALANGFNTMAERLQEAERLERQERETLQKAFQDYINFAAKVSQGDLTSRLSQNGHDEYRALAENLNGMAAGLGDLSRQVRDGTQAMGAASSDILATVSEHTASANQQAAALHETSTTVQEVRAVAEQAAQRANSVAELAQNSVRVGQEGDQAVNAIVQSMHDLRERVEAIARDIMALSEQTQQIGEITATVSDIADQSNLLALNAAIEAAKAGEQGKGFAVVAAEVRNLAEQSKQATSKVRSILGSIQKATNAAVLATEQGSKGVESGLGLALRAGQVIGQLVEVIQQAAQAAQQIAASAHQQSVGMDQIAQAMGEISQATTQFVTGARQSQTAAEGLKNLAGQLQLSTERYRI